MNDRIRKADEFSHQQHANRETQRAAIAAANPVQMPDSPRNDPSFKSEEFGGPTEKEMHANFGQPRRTDTYSFYEADDDAREIRELYNRNRTRDI